MESEISSVILICSGECKRDDDLFNAVQGWDLKKREHLRKIGKERHWKWKLKKKEDIMVIELAISKELDGR